MDRRSDCGEIYTVRISDWMAEKRSSRDFRCLCQVCFCEKLPNYRVGLQDLAAEVISNAILKECSLDVRMLRCSARCVAI